MKITLEKNQENKTTLEDTASIYSARDERTPREKLKAFKGKEKIQYFCSYFLWKYLLIIAGVIALISLIYTMFFRVVPQDRFSVYVINTPFGPNAIERVRDELKDMFVTDEDTEKVTVDDQYYFWTEDYNYRMVYVAHIASSDADLLILDKNEFYQQVNNEVIIPVKDVLSPELYAELSDYYEYATPKTEDVDGEIMIGEEDVYGLNIKPYLERVNSEYAVPDNYCMAFIVNSKHTGDFDKVTRYILGK